MEVFERTYSDLITYESFDDRLEYLEFGGSVGRDTFGFDRYLNQAFYKSVEWDRIRRHVLIRDEGRDLGVEGHEIFARPLVHHMNPVSPDDLLHKRDWILDPEFLITVSHKTHNAIHYGIRRDLMPSGPRTPGDTNLW